MSSSLRPGDRCKFTDALLVKDDDGHAVTEAEVVDVGPDSILVRFQNCGRGFEWWCKHNQVSPIGEQEN